jgi:hypothetical protein
MVSDAPGQLPSCSCLRHPTSSSGRVSNASQQTKSHSQCFPTQIAVASTRTMVTIRRPPRQDRVRSAIGFGVSRGLDDHWANQRPRLGLDEKQNFVYTIGGGGSNPTVDRLPTGRRRTSPKLTSNGLSQPEIAAGIFFI